MKENIELTLMLYKELESSKNIENTRIGNIAIGNKYQAVVEGYQCIEFVLWPIKNPRRKIKKFCEYIFKKYEKAVIYPGEHLDDDSLCRLLKIPCTENEIKAIYEYDKNLFKNLIDWNESTAKVKLEDNNINNYNLYEHIIKISTD